MSLCQHVKTITNFRVCGINIHETNPENFYLSTRVQCYTEKHGIVTFVTNKYWNYISVHTTYMISILIFHVNFWYPFIYVFSMFYLLYFIYYIIWYLMFEMWKFTKLHKIKIILNELHDNIQLYSIVLYCIQLRIVSFAFISCILFK